MCEIEISVNEEINSDFVLYNIVFSTPRAELMDTDSLHNELANFGIEMNINEINDYLMRWASHGLLERKNNTYCIA